MLNFLSLAYKNWLLPVPGFIWRRRLTAHDPAALAFMTPDHHTVRNFCVRELPRVGRPLTHEAIASGTGLPLERVEAVTDDLERHLTFLYRTIPGAVTWAYPVTVEQTPHQITFSSGEKLYAA